MAYLEHADFSEGDLFNERILFGFDELLDGHNLARLAVSALVDDAVGALAHATDLLVALHEVRRRRPRPEHREKSTASVTQSTVGSQQHTDLFSVLLLLRDSSSVVCGSTVVLVLE